MPRSREPTELPFPQRATLEDDHTIKSHCPNCFFYYNVIQYESADFVSMRLCRYVREFTQDKTAPVYQNVMLKNVF